jgi:hypothetical protein
MGYFYVDDTVHERGNFVLCAAVYSRDEADSDVRRELKKAGLTPGRDEFKSRIRMDQNPNMTRLRSRLMSDIHKNRKLGIIVAPISDRERLGSVVLGGLAHFVSSNEVVDRAGIAFLDQGMFSSVRAAEREVSKYGVLTGYHVHFEQDSRAVLGIQLADLAAHTCGIMLLDRLGIVQKTVKAGENSGYDPDMDLELGFSLWAQLRYSFFRHKHPDRDGENPLLDSRSGLFVAPTCSSGLAEAALRQFGDIYMGCIH